MAAKISPLDSAEYLDNPESVEAYLEDALESNDPAIIAHAFGVIARAKGMSRIAQDAGLSRESLYKALSADGNPELATVLKVIKALGLKLTLAPNHHATRGCDQRRARNTAPLSLVVDRPPRGFLSALHVRRRLRARLAFPARVGACDGCLPALSPHFMRR